MTDNTTDRESYWNSYYQRARPKGANPSQFAVFVLGELDGQSSIVDIGCGSGRDTFFFASHGHRVTGVDASTAAIDACREIAATSEDEVAFESLSVEDNAVIALSDAQRTRDGVSLPAVVYARFFVHAITEEEEARLIDNAARCCAAGGRMALEFRTERDSALAKVTEAHYRRFVKPLDFLSRVIAAGFTVDYFVEGYGYAKYKQDDAYVARVMLSRAAS